MGLPVTTWIQKHPSNLGVVLRRIYSLSSVSASLRSILRRSSAGNHHNSLPIQPQLRWFSVKELPWCAPRGSPNRERNVVKDSGNPQQQQQQEDKDDDSKPSCKFGIVAAMSNNRIIGVNGGLPWNVPSDRQFFVQLTRKKLLIVGRHTFYERPNLSHISHARATIVVSQTLAKRQQQDHEPQQTSSEAVTTTTGHSDNQKIPDQSVVLYFVESFPKALEKAAELAHSYSSVEGEPVHESVATTKGDDSDKNNNDDDDDDETRSNNNVNDNNSNHPSVDQIDCWVAGGEKLYQEALQHPMAQFLHLTIFDQAVPVDELSSSTAATVARFPAKYRWDHKFRLVVEETTRTWATTTTTTTTTKQPQPNDGEWTYTRYLYQHINRLRQKKEA
ncbi:hypothetical protein ACA910_005585 [Epithemia clementina (nom. ined.)]